MKTAEKNACWGSVLEICALIGLDEADNGDEYDVDDDDTKGYNETTAALQRSDMAVRGRGITRREKKRKEAKTKKAPIFQVIFGVWVNHIEVDNCGCQPQCKPAIST